MKRPLLNLSRPVLGLLLLASILPAGGCEVYEPTWILTVDSTTLYSLSRPEYMGRVGAYDFARSVSRGGGAVIVERNTLNNALEFDFAISEVDGELVALPAGLFEGVTVDPGIAIDSSGIDFEDWGVAPRDGYVTDEPVPLETGVLYAVRSRRGPLDGCTHYGKFEVLSIEADGVVHLQAVRNHLCNDRELIPPDED